MRREAWDARVDGELVAGPALLAARSLGLHRTQRYRTLKKVGIPSGQR